jgi:DNA repair exonuclease SbcCD nuclease subunit
VKFIHTADIHLKEKTSENFNALVQILALAEEEKCDALIIAGDLFEKGYISRELRGEVRALFNSYPNLIKLLLPGNHDATAYTDETDYGKNTFTFHRLPYQELTLRDIRIIGFPYQPYQKDTPWLDKFSDTSSRSILIVHGTLYGSNLEKFYTPEDTQYQPLFVSQLKDKFSYVALGHFHRQFTKHQAGRTYFVYPGTPVALTKKEVGIRKIALVEITSEVTLLEKPLRKSPFWERLECFLIPFSEEIFKKLDKDIEKIATPEKLLEIKLHGFTHLSDRELQGRCQALKEKYQSCFRKIEFDQREVTGLLEMPPSQESVVQKFISEVKKRQSKLSPPVFEETLRLGLEAINKYLGE